MIEYVKQKNLIDPPGLFEDALRPQETMLVNFAVLVGRVKFLHRKKFSGKATVAGQHDIVKIDDRERQIFRRDWVGEDLQSCDCRGIVVNIDSREPDGRLRI
jgi:hypothetical protein